MFTPPTPLNRVPSGCSTGVQSVTISLGPAPWNEILPKRYPSPGIPVVQLWQNSCNLSCTIPLGFTPPVEAKRRSRPSGSKIPQRVTPWNLYPARNLDKNGHIEVEYFNLLKPDGTIPLGFWHHSKNGFSKSSTNAALATRKGDTNGT